MSERVQDLYEENGFEELLERASRNAANNWEASFVADMKSRYAKFGRRMYLSEVQQATFENIAGYY